MQEEIRPPRPEERAAFLAIAAEYLPGIPPARVADMPLQLCLARGEALIGVAYAEPRTQDKLCLQGIAVVHPYNAQGRGGALLRAGLRGLGGRLRRAVLPEKRLCAGGAEDLRALGRDGAARRGLRRHGQAQPHRGARRRAQLLCVPEGIVTNFNTKQRSYCLYT